jgi:hypothetical protein
LKAFNFRGSRPKTQVLLVYMITDRRKSSGNSRFVNIKTQILADSFLGSTSLEVFVCTLQIF